MNIFNSLRDNHLPFTSIAVPGLHLNHSRQRHIIVRLFEKCAANTVYEEIILENKLHICITRIGCATPLAVSSCFSNFWLLSGFVSIFPGNAALVPSLKNPGCTSAYCQNSMVVCHRSNVTFASVLVNCRFFTVM